MVVKVDMVADDMFRRFRNPQDTAIPEAFFFGFQFDYGSRPVGGSTPSIGALPLQAHWAHKPKPA